ncbi:hypothetical protein Tco_0558564 [Tanacetum coccineum]
MEVMLLLVEEHMEAELLAKISHLLAVKRIFRYLKGKPSLGLWYSKDSPWELVAYTNSDYAGATQDRKSTTRGCQFLGNRATTDDNGDVQLTATIDGHSRTITEASLRRHLKLDDHDRLLLLIPNSRRFFEQLALMGYHKDSDKLTFQKGAFSPQWSIKVFKNMKRPTKGYSGQEVALFPAMLNVFEPSTSPSRITSSPSPSTKPSPSHSPAPSIEHSPDPTTATVLFPSPTQPSPETEQQIPTPHDSPLHVVHSHRSDEGSLKLIELTNLVTKLSKRIGVLEDDLKKTKLTYSVVVTKLILRVKKLEAQVKAGKARKRSLSRKHVRKEILKFVLCGATKNGNASDRSSDLVRSRKILDCRTRAQIARDEEIARQWDEEERQRAMSEAKSTKKIDWNDPSVIRYHALKMKPKTVAQARRNMAQYLKRFGILTNILSLWSMEVKEMKSLEKIEEEDVDTPKE